MKGNEVVTLTRPGEPDWQGDRAPGGVYTLRGCQLWPRSSTEDATQGRVIIEGWNVYVPAGQPLVEATDTLTIRGEQHQVVGQPGRYDLKGKDKGQIVVTSKAGGQ